MISVLGEERPAPSSRARARPRPTLVLVGSRRAIDRVAGTRTRGDARRTERRDRARVGGLSANSCRDRAAPTRRRVRKRSTRSTPLRPRRAACEYLENDAKRDARPPAPEHEAIAGTEMIACSDRSSAGHWRSSPPRTLHVLLALLDTHPEIATGLRGSGHQRKSGQDGSYADERLVRDFRCHPDASVASGGPALGGVKKQVLRPLRGHQDDSLLLEVEREIHRRRRVRQRADGNPIDARLGDRADRRAAFTPPDASRIARPATSFTHSRHRLERHVVEHDDVGAGVRPRARPARRGRTRLRSSRPPARARARASPPSRRRRRRGEVVVLDQHARSRDPCGGSCRRRRARRTSRARASPASSCACRGSSRCVPFTAST